MGSLRPLYNATVTVAPVSSTDERGTVTLGVQVEVEGRLNTDASAGYGDVGSNADNVTRFTTQEREFDLSDRVWLPGDDTKNDRGRELTDAGKSSTLGETVYYFEL